MKRAGGQTLTLLAAPLNVHILRALEEGPKTLLELRQAAGCPSQSTMQVCTRSLGEMNVLERQKTSGAGRGFFYSLTPPGAALLKTGDVVQRWLDESPKGPCELGTLAAKNTLGALVGGWSTNIIRALAAKPLSLTDLNRLISNVNYGTLDRRLEALRLTRLVLPDPHPGDGRATRYRATRWLRRAVIPLTAAVGWERTYLPKMSPAVGQLDVEAAFLLAVPLMDLPEDLTGKCRLAVKVRRGSRPVLAGVLVSVEEGKVVSCTSRLEGGATGQASGSASEWLRRLSGQGDEGLEMKGNVALVLAITDALRKVPASKR